MKISSKKSIILLFILILIVAISSIAYNYSQKNRKMNDDTEMLLYSGKTDSGVGFSIKYPSTWVYYKFNCNADGLAFWPKITAPDFSKGGECNISGFLEKAPVILYTMSNTELELKNTNFQNIFNQMKSTLSN